MNLKLFKISLRLQIFKKIAKKEFKTTMLNKLEGNIKMGTVNVGKSRVEAAKTVSAPIQKPTTRLEAATAL